MSTVVYQGLESCLDSHLLESRTVLRLKLSSPKLHFSQSLESALRSSSSSDSNTTKLEEKSQKNASNPDMGGWSFLQALPSCSQAPKQASMEEKNVYVHPLVKGSSSTLSEKSLEMCTENLGSETGTDEMIQDTIFSVSSSDSMSGKSATREQNKSRQLLGTMKANLQGTSPPPLTTMRGSECVQVRPYREDGRLIIKAFKETPVHTYFQAERCHGRLRLWVLRSEEEELENDTNAEEEEEDEEEEEEEEEEVGEDMEGNCLNVGRGIGMENYERPSRCKEGEGSERKELRKWEPLWVTSTS